MSGVPRGVRWRQEADLRQAAVVHELHLRVGHRGVGLSAGAHGQRLGGCLLRADGARQQPLALLPLAGAFQPRELVVAGLVGVPQLRLGADAHGVRVWAPGDTRERARRHAQAAAQLAQAGAAGREAHAAALRRRPQYLTTQRTSEKRVYDG